MTERERLIELLKVPIHPRIGADPAEVVADYLLDNGVIVLPCKVGDTVYVICDGEISDQKVMGIDINPIRARIATECHFYHECVEEEPCICEAELCRWYFSDYEFGKSVFLTCEEAKKALKEREKNG